MKKVVFALIATGWLGAIAPAASEEAASPASGKETPTVQIINIGDADFKEVVPGGAVSMKVLAGKTLEAAVFKGQSKEGSKQSAPFHKHGEELTIVLKAPPGGKFIAGGKEYTIKEGDIMIIPEGLEHGGDFGAGESLVITVNSPPRFSVPGNKPYIEQVPTGKGREVPAGKQ